VCPWSSIGNTQAPRYARRENAFRSGTGKLLVRDLLQRGLSAADLGGGKIGHDIRRSQLQMRVFSDHSKDQKSTLASLRFEGKAICKKSLGVLPIQIATPFLGGDALSIRGVGQSHMLPK